MGIADKVNANIAKLNLHTGQISDILEILASDDTTLNDLQEIVDFIKLNSEDLDAEKALLASHTSDVDNPHAVTKTQVGLGNVDNTSDIDKPVSTATQVAIDVAKNLVDANALAYSIALG